jgi:transposase
LTVCSAFYNGLRKLDKIFRKDNEPDIIKPQKKAGLLLMKKRVFSAEFKAERVLEVLRGEKELNQIASTHEIAPNQLRNWKNEFLANAANVFDNKKDKVLQEKVKDQERENDSLYKKVGQLTTQVDWLKKKSEEILGPDWESRFTPRPKG